MPKKIFFLTAISLSCIFLANCQKNTISSVNGLTITTTTGMIADITTQIIGEHGQVTALMNSGIDPHVYKATQGDLSKLREADLIIYNGLHLEGKLNDILKKLSKTQHVVAVTHGLDEDIIYHQGEADPHIWFDIALWAKASKNITQALCNIDQAHCNDYKSNSEKLTQTLTHLDNDAKKKLATIPKASRVLVTAHDAFSYLGRAYDIEVVGLQGISTATEFGLQDIARVQDIIINRRVKAVFIESSVPEKFIKSLQAGVIDKGHQVKLGGKLFSDAMGAPNTLEGTYLGMVKHNINTITEALK